MIPVGNPAVGNDFIDREKEISLILSTLEKDSVLLIAPPKVWENLDYEEAGKRTFRCR